MQPGTSPSAYFFEDVRRVARRPGSVNSAHRAAARRRLPARPLRCLSSPAAAAAAARASSAASATAAAARRARRRDAGRERAGGDGPRARGAAAAREAAAAGEAADRPRTSWSPTTKRTTRKRPATRDSGGLTAERARPAVDLGSRGRRPRSRGTTRPSIAVRAARALRSKKRRAATSCRRRAMLRLPSRVFATLKRLFIIASWIRSWPHEHGQRRPTAGGDAAPGAPEEECRHEEKRERPGPEPAPSAAGKRSRRSGRSPTRSRWRRGR